MTSIVAENIARYLGGREVLKREVKTNFDLAALVDENLPVEAADCVIGEGLLDADELYELIIPRRTLTKRRSTTGRLTTDESDRLVRVARIVAIAVTTFDDRATALEWLRRSNRALANQRPIDLLATENGSRLVETILGRIEYGVYS